MDYECLIVDDEEALANNTAEYFNLFNIKSKALYSAKECEEFFKENTCRLILLDINLKEDNGFLLCKKLRETLDIPIIFISARNTDDDKIMALNIGGDDYIEKPYSLAVLLAKVKVILKRMTPSTSNVWTDGWLTIDKQKKLIVVNGVEVKLTQMEYKLLTYLMENSPRVISKAELFENVWEDMVTGDGTLNVHIRHLREAIEEKPNSPKYIITVWGDGYRFKEL